MDVQDRQRREISEATLEGIGLRQAVSAVIWQGKVLDGMYLNRVNLNWTTKETQFSAGLGESLSAVGAEYLFKENMYITHTIQYRYGYIHNDRTS